jgi:daunorubicin resistance ABC transporter ATP-binding subunit
LSNDNVVVVEKLVKVYPGGTRAVSNIDFTVARGEFFGFLGPNGAGKTTTMKVLSTLLKKTSGRVVVAGHDVDSEPHNVRKSIGFAMQEVGLDDLATGWDFLVLQGLLYGLGRSEARRRAGELLELVGLADVAKRKVGTYSGGMRRRIDMVAALMHRPQLLFLDEPTTGLDPQSRLAIWEYLVQLNSEGVTIFLTTQMMEEADRLCRRIAIIDLGQIVTEGSPQALKAGIGGDVIRVTFDSMNTAADVSYVAKAEELVGRQTYVSKVTRTDSSLTIRVQNSGDAVPDLMKQFHLNQIDVSNLSISSPTLDDVFLKYTGRQIRSEGTSGDEAAQSARPWLGLSSKR